MFMIFVLMVAWQGSGNNIYQEPLKKSVEAEYSKSELKSNVDKFVEKISDKAPGMVKISPAIYSLAIRKQFQFSSPKITPIKNTIATYQMSNYNSGLISLTWSF